jgi:hypothetical protein
VAASNRFGTHVFLTDFGNENTFEDIRKKNVFLTVFQKEVVFDKI